MRPVGVGRTSPGPIGVDGLTMIAGTFNEFAAEVAAPLPQTLWAGPVLGGLLIVLRKRFGVRTAVA